MQTSEAALSPTFFLFLSANSVTHLFALSAMDTNLVVAMQKTEDLVNVTVTLNAVTQMCPCANVHFRQM